MKSFTASPFCVLIVEKLSCCLPVIDWLPLETIDARPLSVSDSASYALIAPVWVSPHATLAVTVSAALSSGTRVAGRVRRSSADSLRAQPPPPRLCCRLPGRHFAGAPRPGLLQPMTQKAQINPGLSPQLDEKRGSRHDPYLAEDLRNRFPHGLPQHKRDLLIAEPRLLHQRSPPGQDG
jgi:hypothetical protein